jgi:hypothetical protein
MKSEASARRKKESKKKADIAAGQRDWRKYGLLHSDAAAALLQQ